MAKPDVITLTGLRAFGYHGVFDFERREGQEFIVDLVVGLDMRPAAHSDDVADTVDYGALATDVTAIVTGEPLNLIEALAERIADAVLRHPLVQVVTVTVHKPSAPIPTEFGDVTVTLTRERA
ncbi:MAG TPA: dihydroneopterin aldolase [Microbacteriaceae bacterium]|jgi:dihydroneopterin aldolase|nr:dihydroneopterin aldolase [Microbacteriaceae bacterium]HPZ34761.1 dihydroneopterin aldolase [Microbacteriaceae bacterium]HQC93012.1 dihydroneopterin aldolase [Microbacteriaceae bacterium]